MRRAMTAVCLLAAVLSAAPAVGADESWRAWLRERAERGRQPLPPAPPAPPGLSESRGLAWWMVHRSSDEPPRAMPYPPPYYYGYPPPPYPYAPPGYYPWPPLR